MKNDSVTFGELLPLLTGHPRLISTKLAEYMSVGHQSIQNLIAHYEMDFLEYGSIEETTAENNQAGGTVYLLNEEQVFLLMTYLENTEPVRRVKSALVYSFCLGDV